MIPEFDEERQDAAWDARSEPRAPHPSPERLAAAEAWVRPIVQALEAKRQNQDWLDEMDEDEWREERSLRASRGSEGR